MEYFTYNVLGSMYSFSKAPVPSIFTWKLSVANETVIILGCGRIIILSDARETCKKL